MSKAVNLQVGDWLIEPDLDRVTGPGGEAQLMPKAMAVLVYLAERPGQVVGAEELINDIWHGRPMGDNPVYKCVSELRAVLGDDPKVPAYIATVPTKGYRLVAAVRRADVEDNVGIVDRTEVADIPARPGNRRHLVSWLGVVAAASLLVALYWVSRERPLTATDETAPFPAAGQPSIAVLPFANMSPGAGQDHIADGLTEELISQLALVPGLRVIGRTSSFAFQGKNEDLRTIGQVLGVNHILEGSVRKAGNRIRVTAQLINPVDGSHLWTQTYDRSLEDLFTLQEEVAKTVASALRLTIAARNVEEGGTRSFAAYDDYLTGLAAAGKGGADNVLVSIAAFDRAVAVDHGFITAWEALAGALQQAFIDVPSRRPEWQERLSGTEKRIAALAPDRPLLIHLSAQKAMLQGNLVEAERLYRSIKPLSTNQSPLSGSYGVFLLTVGRPREALTQFMRGLQADPLKLESSLWVQIALELTGDFEQAEQEYRRSLDFSEDTRAVRTMALVRAMGERNVEAIRRELEEQIAVGPLTRSLNEAMAREIDQPALALAKLHRYIDDPNSMNSGIIIMTIAAWASYFGDPQLALKAIKELPLHAGNAFNWTVWRPVQSEMRRLPEFKTLLKERGLVDYWRKTGKWGSFCQPVGEDDFTCDPGPAGR